MSSSVFEKCDEGGFTFLIAMWGAQGDSQGNWLVGFGFFSVGSSQHCLCSGIRKGECRGKGRIVSPDPKETDRSGKIPDFLGLATVI